jgi:hypothetical protein
MIDPRALQQHFQKVHKKELPEIVTVPRVPDLEPLTAVQAIVMPVEKVVKLEQELLPDPALEVAKEKINLIIDALPPIDSIVVDEFEDEENTEVAESNYDPYGYYSSTSSKTES